MPLSLDPHRYLGVQATVDDVIDVMRTCDADSDQNLNWGEFAEMLRWNDEALGRCDKVLLASGAVKIVKEELDRCVVERMFATSKHQERVFSICSCRSAESLKFLVFAF